MTDTARTTFDRQVNTYRKSIAQHKFLVPSEDLIAGVLDSIAKTILHGHKDGTNAATLMLVAAITKAATDELVDWSATEKGEQNG